MMCSANARMSLLMVIVAVINFKETFGYQPPIIKLNIHPHCDFGFAPYQNDFNANDPNISFPNGMIQQNSNRNQNKNQCDCMEFSDFGPGSTITYNPVYSNLTLHKDANKFRSEVTISLIQNDGFVKTAPLLDVIPCDCKQGSCNADNKIEQELRNNYCESQVRVESSNSGSSIFNQKNKKYMYHRQILESHQLSILHSKNINGRNVLVRNHFHYDWELFIPDYIKQFYVGDNLTNGPKNSEKEFISQSSYQKYEEKYQTNYHFQDKLLFSTYFYNQTFNKLANQIYSEFCVKVKEYYLGTVDRRLTTSIFDQKYLFNPKIFSCFDHYMCKKFWSHEPKIMNGRCPVYLDPHRLLCFYPEKASKERKQSEIGVPCPIYETLFERIYRLLNTELMMKSYNNSDEINPFINEFEKLMIDRALDDHLYDFPPTLQLLMPHIKNFKEYSCRTTSKENVFKWSFQDKKVEQQSRSTSISSELIKTCANNHVHKCDRHTRLDLKLSPTTNPKHITEILRRETEQKIILTGEIVSILCLAIACIIWRIKTLRCWRNTLHVNLAVSGFIYGLSIILIDIATKILQNLSLYDECIQLMPHPLFLYNQYRNQSGKFTNQQVYDQCCLSKESSPFYWWIFSSKGEEEDKIPSRIPEFQSTNKIDRSYRVPARTTALFFCRFFNISKVYRVSLYV